MIHLYGREYQAPHRQCFHTKSKRKRRKTPTERDSFRISFVPFGARKTGERQRTVKGLPARDGKKFCRNRHFVFLSKFLDAFDRVQCFLTVAKPKGTKLSRLGNKMRGLLRFFQQEFLSVGFL